MSKSNIMKSAMICGITTMILLLNAGNAKAQLVRPMDKGVPDSVAATCLDTAGNYYVAYNVRDTSVHFQFNGYIYTDTFAVAVWNGTFWSEYPHFNSNAGYGMNILVYQGELYIQCSYKSGVVVMRWHSDNWDTVSKQMNGTVNQMFLYNKNLLFTGSFTKAGGQIANRIAAWNGTKIDSLGGGIANGMKIININTTCIHKNTLMVGAILDSAGRHNHRIVQWNGASWNVLPYMVSQQDSEEVNAMISANGRLYVSRQSYIKKYGYDDDSLIYEWNGAAWNKMQLPIAVYPFSSYLFSTYNNNLIVFGQDKAYKMFCLSLDSSSWSVLSRNMYAQRWNYSYGIQNSSPVVVEYKGKLIVNNGAGFSIWDGTTWSSFQGFSKSFGSYYGLYFIDANAQHLYFAGNFNVLAKRPINYVGEFTTHVSSFSGKVYIDLDSNCKYDVTDIPARNAFVKIAPNGYITNTDSDGNYTVFSDTPNCTVTAILPKYGVSSCPSSGSATFNFPRDSSVQNVDFAVKFNEKINDLKMTLSCNMGYRFHPMIKQYFYLTYENIGTTIQSGKIYFKKPVRLINFSASPKEDSVNSAIAYWSFYKLYPGDKRLITVELNADKDLKKGDSLVFNTWFDSATTAKDSDKSNNSDTLVMVSGDSHDPNNKQSYPPADITQSTKEIKYHIEFQNTGNTEARQIVVIDTIDANLPLTEVIMNSSSHKYRLDINNNVFRWTFNDINLSDSTSDEKHSHGFISYTAKIKQGIAAGTAIKNKAYIYFDYNKPMPTNQTMNKIGIKTSEIEPIKISESINVFPNPANEELMIDNRSPETKKFIIYNSVGQAMTQLQIGKDQREILNTTAFPAGIYFIRGEKGESGKFVIQH